MLGPEKLPEARAQVRQTYAELKKMGNSFQSEVRNALDEPMKEMRETADLLRKAADFDFEPTRVDGRHRRAGDQADRAPSRRGSPPASQPEAAPPSSIGRPAAAATSRLADVDDARRGADAGRTAARARPPPLPPTSHRSMAPATEARADEASRSRMRLPFRAAGAAPSEDARRRS